MTLNFGAWLSYLEEITAPLMEETMPHPLCSFVLILCLLLSVQLSGTICQIMAIECGKGQDATQSPKTSLQSSTHSLPSMKKAPGWLRDIKRGLEVSLPGQLPSQQHMLQTLHESQTQSAHNSGTAHWNNWSIPLSTPPHRLPEHLNEIKSTRYTLDSWYPWLLLSLPWYTDGDTR